MRNVIFDLGGVVLEWNPDAILESYYADSEARVILKSALFQHPDWLLMDRGMLTETEAVTRLEQRTGRPRLELIGLFDAVRRSLLPKPETVALIERLVRQHVPLYCLSNMAADTFSYLHEHHAFWPAFRGIVISGQIQMMKPDHEIFEYLLNRYGLTPAETVFIDDHQPNIRAARDLGIHTVWFRNARQCEADLIPLLGAKRQSA